MAYADRRPVIGISDTHKEATNASVPRSYVDAVLQAGGIPVVIPLIHDENEMIELINALDGIIFTGGEDFDPAYYHERPIPQMGKVNAPRDKFDLNLIRLSAERSVPILGICRGMQLINIAFGGTLYQDLPTQYRDKTIRHRQTQPNTEATHSVIVEENTFFADFVREKTLMVNSAHHQAAKDLAKGFRVAGRSTDQVVEAIEKIDDDHWILGVQFHPEMRATKDMAMRRIFHHFIEEARNTQKPVRPERPLIASRPQNDRAPSRETSKPAPTPPREIIYRTVVDTLYKYIRDTIYFPLKADTVFITSKPVIKPKDTVYITSKPVIKPADTVYVTVTDTKTIYVTDTIYITRPEVTCLDGSVSERTVEDVKKDIVCPDSVVLKQVSTIESAENKPLILASDTLIFTPGATVAPVTKKSDSSKSQQKKAEKEKAKEEKKKAAEREKQRQKARIEKANQSEKKKEEQEKKDKVDKKLAKAQEKEFIKQQKENAKIDKKELKEAKKQGTYEKE